MSNLQIFNFNSVSIRTINIDGEILFVAKDVADCLGYADHAQAIKDHCKKPINFTGGEKTDVNEIKELSRTRSLIIPESDVYRLVMRSKLESAEMFQDFVVEEVLPSIRKTGGYSMSQQPKLPNFSDEIEAAKAWIEAKESEKAALSLVASQKETIQHKDDLIRISNEANVKAGEILVREFVKSQDLVDMGEKQFYQWMRDQGYLLKGSREPSQKYVKLGYFTWKPSEELHGGKFRYTMRVTPRGKVWLAAKYMAYLDTLGFSVLGNNEAMI